MENKTRLQWIDFARGIAILLVIMGHCKPPFLKIINSFHIPLFFMISGYLLKEDDKNILLPKLTNKLLHRFIQPYFIFCIINLFLNFAYQNFVVFLKKETVFDVCLYFSTNVKGILYSRGTVTCMPNCSPLWFLTALFSACLIYNMIYRIKSEFIKIICLVLCPILSYVFDVSGIVKLPWNIDSACMGVAYLEIGNQIKKRQMLEKFDAFSLNKKMFLCVILFIGGMVAAVLNPISVSFDDNSYGNIACLLIASISLGVVVFFIAYSMKKCENLSSKDLPSSIGFVISTE